MRFEKMPYKRVDFNEISANMQEIQRDFTQAANAQEQFAVHQRYYKVLRHVNTQWNLANIRHSMDTSDTFYEKEKQYYDEKMPQFSNEKAEYQKLLYHSPFKKELEEIIGKPAFRYMELVFQSVSEKIIPLMQQENTLVTKYEKLLAGAQISWNGEILNLSMMEPYLFHPDRKIRREASGKVNEFYESVAEQLDEIYDQLVKNRTEQARELGFSSYTQLGYCRMNRNSYEREDVERFRSQIKEFWVPLAERVWEKRKERLGFKEYFYMDEGLSFPEGSPQPVGTAQEILEQGRKMYSQMSDETKEFFDFMMENNLLDVFGRKNKQVGGYMEFLPEFEAPFIFANFNGTSKDVDVITHECGHAFQGYLTRKAQIAEHQDITMETAETHSMSMEFFTNPFMELFFGDRAQDFLTAQLEDAITFIPYGCMVDEFQHIAYDNPQMTPQERKEVWKKLEEIYIPHRVYEPEAAFYARGCYWQRQHHIYSSPFYYIDYAIAQTDAFQYRIWMQEEYEEAWESYLGFCKAGASGFFTDMLLEAGLMNPFEEGTIRKIVESLEEEI